MWFVFFVGVGLADPLTEWCKYAWSLERVGSRARKVVCEVESGQRGAPHLDRAWINFWVVAARHCSNPAEPVTGVIQVSDSMRHHVIDQLVRLVTMSASAVAATQWTTDAMMLDGIIAVTLLHSR